MDAVTKEPETVGELVDQLPARVEPQPWMSPGAALVQLAIEKGADLPTLERLMGLQERWETNEARKAYIAALAAFKAEPPTIIKNKAANYGNGKAAYEYATLDVVAAAIGAALAKHGLSASWRTAQTEGRIKVTCELRHALGHSEETSLEAGADTSGSKNSIQAIGSTVTYLSRYTLLAITGLAASGMDDDAKAGAADETINAAQKNELIELIKEAEADTPKMLAYFKVATIDEIPAARFQDARDMLVRKINATKTPNAA